MNSHSVHQANGRSHRQLMVYTVDGSQRWNLQGHNRADEVRWVLPMIRQLRRW